MTCDIVALVRNQPDVRTVIEGMVAFGERVEPREVSGGVTQLYDPAGRLLVSIETPVLVTVPGEVARLLDSDQAARVEPPLWWVDVRAAAGLPDAERIARKFADDLVHWQGGAVWTGTVGTGTVGTGTVGTGTVGAPQGPQSGQPGQHAPYGQHGQFGQSGHAGQPGLTGGRHGQSGPQQPPTAEARGEATR